MRVISLCLLLTTASLAQVLYLLDCGSHGEKMRNIILAEGFAGQLIYTKVTQTTCEENINLTEENAYGQVLANLSSNNSTEVRMSLSFGVRAGVHSSGIERLLKAGVKVWAAAGNDGDEDGCYWPAAQEGVRAVVATDSSGELQAGVSTGCKHKPTDQRVRVSACYSSDATAIASARGIDAYFTRQVGCIPGWLWKYQWQITYALICLLVLFLIGIGSYCVVLRCKGQVILPQP